MKIINATAYKFDEASDAYTEAAPLEGSYARFSFVVDNTGGVQWPGYTYVGWGAEEYEATSEDHIVGVGFKYDDKDFTAGIRMDGAGYHHLYDSKYRVVVEVFPDQGKVHSELYNSTGDLVASGSKSYNQSIDYDRFYAARDDPTRGGGYDSLIVKLVDFSIIAGVGGQGVNADLDASTRCGRPGEPIRFKATGSSAEDGDITSYEWTVDGQPVDASGPTFTTSFLNTTSHTVSVSVTGDGETDTADRQVYISNDGEAYFVYRPTNATVGDPVSFTACDQEEEEDPEWQFDDGSTATGSQVTHTFDEAGTYNVTLQTGSDESVTRPVNVTAGGVEITDIEPRKDIYPVANFPVNETYEVSVTATDTSVSHVEFDLLYGSTTVDTDGSDGYTRTLDFQNVTAPTYLRVTAVGENGSTDSQRYFVPVYTAEPLAVFLDTCQQLGGGCTTLPVEYTRRVSSDGIQRLNNALGNRTVEVEAGASLSLRNMAVDAYGTGSVSSPFPQRLIQRTPLPASATVEGSATLSGGANLTPVSNHSFDIEQDPLAYSAGVTASAGADVPTPGSIPVVGGVEVHVESTAELTAEGQVRNRTLDGPLNPTLDTATVGASGSAMPQISVVVCDARAGPEVTASLTYEPPSGNLTGVAELLARAELDCMLYSDSYSTSIATITYPTSGSPTVTSTDGTVDPDWDLRNRTGVGPDGASDAEAQSTGGGTDSAIRRLASGTETATADDVDRITSDDLADESPALTGSAGNYTLVWDRQDPEKDVTDGHDIFVATDSGDGWSSPAHLTDDDRIDTDPDIATAGGDRVAVWARADRSFTTGDLESFAGPSEVLDNLELAVATDANGSWSEPTLLTDDNVIDIDPEVVVSGDAALVTWTRDLDGDLTTDDRRQAYAVYENGSLSPVETVDADALDAVATGSGFRLAYAAGDTVTVGTVDDDGVLTTTDTYSVNAVESNVTSVAVGPDETAWVAGHGENQTLQVADPGGIQTLQAQANVTGLTELTLETTADETLLTYRGRTPGINGSTLYYRLQRDGQWVTDHGFASGTGSNLTVWDATTALTSSGFRSVYMAQPYVAFGSDEDPRADLFSTRHSFQPDYAIEANTSTTTAAPGDQISVNYTLANEGDVATSSDVTVELVNASGVVATATHGPLAAGEEVTGTFTTAADESGELTVQVATGQTGSTSEKSTTQTAELSESNNQVTLQTGTSDLRVTDVVDTRQGDTLVVSTTVENVGNATVKNGQYTLATDEGALASTDLPAVAPNATRTVSLDVSVDTVTQPKLFTVEVTAANERNASDNVRQVRLAQPDVQIRESSLRFVDSGDGIRAKLPVANAGSGPARTTLEIRNANGTLGNTVLSLNGTEAGTVRYETATVTLPDSAAGDRVTVSTSGAYFDAEPSDDGFATTVSPVLRPPEGPESQWNTTLSHRLQYTDVTVDGDRAFVATLGSNVTALNATTGEVVWRTERTGSLVDSAPVVASDTVYVGSGGGLLYALDRSTGTAKWTADLDSAISVEPAVANGTVYVGANDGTVAAVDAETGEMVWNASLGGAVSGEPTVANGSVHVPLADGTVVALDASSGDRLWTSTLGGDLTSRGLAVSNGTVVAAADDLVALDAATGEIAWQRAYNDTSGVAPVIDNETVYVGAGNGTVLAVNVSTGDAAWRHSAASRVRPTVAVDGSAVVVGTPDGITVLRRDSGTAVTTSPVGEGVPTSVSVAGDTAYVGTWSGTLYAVDRAS